MAQARSQAAFTYHWLPTLGKIYALVDQAVAVSRVQAAALPGPGTACAQGCAHCCRQAIPASTPEIAGAMWFLAQRAPGAVRKHMRETLLAGRNDDSESDTVCPFLLGSTCAVYPMRFMACRQFMIFGQPCAAGENVWETRSRDLLIPSLPHKLQAFALLASLYGVVIKEPLDPAFLRTFIMDVSAPVQSWNLNLPELFFGELEQGLLKYAKHPTEPN